MATAALVSLSCRGGPATAAAATPVAEAAGMAAMPHGDHDPRHGGTVYMYGEVHYEVILSRDGRHQIYFSDATREDLPAAVATAVTLTVQRPGFTPELLTGTIDEHGECWLLEGAPVAAAGTTARVSFVVNGEPYWIDVPFLVAPPADTASPAPTSTA